MEIVKSRYGLDRSIERIDFERIRVMGESQFVRKSNGNLSFDFEGGPFYSVGGKISFEKMNWYIMRIQQVRSTHKNLYSIILYVEHIY